MGKYRLSACILVKRGAKVRKKQEFQGLLPVFYQKMQDAMPVRIMPPETGFPKKSHPECSAFGVANQAI